MDDPAAPAERRRVPLAIGVAAVVVGLGLVVAALVASDGDDGEGSAAARTTTTAGSTAVDPSGATPSGTTAPTTPAGLGVGVAPERDGRSPLRGFSEVAATITAGDGRVCEVCLLAATDEAQRERGLMEVTDPELGGYDGMLFVYPAEIDGAFWMRNTPSPLSIAYFDARGAVVSTADMAPCEDSPSCRSYPAEAPFRYALEVPQGRLAAVGVEGDAVLRVDGYRCPLA